MIDRRAAASAIVRLAVLASLLACTSAPPLPVQISAARYVRADTPTPALGTSGLLIVCATTFPRDTAVADVLVQAIEARVSARTSADGCAHLALPAGPVALRHRADGVCSRRCHCPGACRICGFAVRPDGASWPPCTGHVSRCRKKGPALQMIVYYRCAAAAKSARTSGWSCRNVRRRNSVRLPS